MLEVEAVGEELGDARGQDHAAGCVLVFDNVQAAEQRLQEARFEPVVGRRGECDEVDARRWGGADEGAAFAGRDCEEGRHGQLWRAAGLSGLVRLMSMLPAVCSLEELSVKASAVTSRPGWQEKERHDISAYSSASCWIIAPRIAFDKHRV